MLATSTIAKLAMDDLLVVEERKLMDLCYSVYGCAIQKMIVLFRRLLLYSDDSCVTCLAGV